MFSRLISILCLLLLLSCQHNTEEADDGLTKKYNPDNAAAYNSQLGLAYLKQGNRPRAKKKLLMALKEAPESPSVNAAMGYFLEKSGEFAEAEAYYKKAIAYSGESGAQLNNFGAYLCRKGEYRKAEEYFLKAVKDIQYEHTAGAYENAGLCVMEIPDLAKASTYFNKALEQDPSRKESLFELLRIELKQDKSKEALATVAKYSTLTLENADILKLAVEAAQRADRNDLANQYQSRINELSFSEKTGVKNEYNHDNG